jgi:CII-binding regulator of phage lambda lysogenization HflD
MNNSELCKAQSRMNNLEKQLKGNSFLDHQFTSNEERYQLRLLEKKDYHKGFLKILSQLSTVGEVSEEKFNQRFESMQNTLGTYYTMVIEDLKEKQIVATATLMIEQKFLRFFFFLIFR